MKICITGAGGFIGSRLMHDLHRNGHEIVPLDDFSNAQVREGVIQEDVRRIRPHHIEGSAVVVHLAALNGVGVCENNEAKAYETNVGATRRIARLCRKYETPMLFPASRAVLRGETNTYAMTKRCAVSLIHNISEDAFPAYNVFFPNIFGEHENNSKKVTGAGVVRYFIERAREGKPLTVHKPGTQTREFLHVKDLVSVLTQMIEDLANENENIVYPIPLEGDERSIMEIAEYISDITNVDVELVENPRDETMGGSHDAPPPMSVPIEHDLESAVREIYHGTQKVTQNVSN